MVVRITSHHTASPASAGHLGCGKARRITVTGIDAKRKLSQNKLEADQVGAVAGLAVTGRPGDVEVAERMLRTRRR
ncbi:MAG: hypothetical protein ACE367_09875 [Acidimicrobiales bacterium]